MTTLKFIHTQMRICIKHSYFSLSESVSMATAKDKESTVTVMTGSTTEGSKVITLLLLG